MTRLIKQGEGIGGKDSTCRSEITTQDGHNAVMFCLLVGESGMPHRLDQRVRLPAGVFVWEERETNNVDCN